MTHVEKMRFQAALQALRGTDSPLSHCLFSRLACFLSAELTGALPQRRAKQRRREPSECVCERNVCEEERMGVNVATAFLHHEAAEHQRQGAGKRL